ncbi:MAG: phosphodiesterase, partial [Acidobacteria bacterium]
MFSANPRRGFSGASHLVLFNVLMLSSILLMPSAALAGDAGQHSRIRHVILISLDGFHDFDLTRYVAGHPTSALARLVNTGVTYANAYTTGPSDSFPGALALTTGGTPISTGIVYDNSWDDTLSPPGSNCATVGTQVLYDESVNTGNGDSWTSSIDPTLLPLDRSQGCTPVFPHQYLKVNTIFNIAAAANLVTAYADKHPTYEIYNGPSGPPATDLYLTESSAFDSDTNPSVLEINDDMKVQAVLNWIDGFNHDRTQHIGVPAIFGMNFQIPNVAQKNYGYADGAGTPTSKLADAYDFVDQELGRMLSELDARHLTASTVFVLASKHGNSPVDPQLKRTTDDGPYADLVNRVAPNLLANLTDDDEAIIWLTDHSKAKKVAAVLRANIDMVGGGTVYVGKDLDALLGGNMIANRRPDVIVESTLGVIYSSHPAKLVEHGGFHETDRHVSLVVSNPALGSQIISNHVSNTQVAPTVLKVLGLNPQALQAVQQENTSVLPGLDALGD